MEERAPIDSGEHSGLPPARARRVGRVAAGWLAALLAIVLLTAAAGQGEGDHDLSEQDVHRGGELYAQNCAACHGAGGGGGVGTGRRAGPPIDDADVALIDLVIRTGRMPIIAPEAGVIRDPQLDDADRARIVAWTADAFDLEGAVPTVPEGDTGRGRLLFNEHCAACHSSTGWGGVAGSDVVPGSLRGLDRVALFSAARVGPLEMPILPATVVTDDELADIATAVEQMEQERPSPLALMDLNHVAGTVFSLVVVALLLALVIVFSRLPRIMVALEEEHDVEEPRDPGAEEEAP